MEQEPLRQLIRSLRDLGEPESDLGDGRLLERFASRRDPAAFELLLWRHGPMVLGVCRRLLGNRHDAEDAFQATFLTLVKKAGTISSGPALAGWLYKVAFRVALKVRADRQRQAEADPSALACLAGPSARTPDGSDLHRVLDEEISRLPARQRNAFILCCLEGKTGEEAARELGCPPGTVSSRLTRARERLRRRLTVRGLTPCLGLPAVALPAALVHSNLKAALLFAAGEAAGGALSSGAVVLARGVMKAMFVKKLKFAALIVLVVGALVGIGSLGRHVLQADPPRPRGKGDSPGQVSELKPADRNDRSVVVRVAKPEPGGLERTADFGCIVRASEEVDLFGAVPGLLTGQTVGIGDRVKKGQLLATIDAPLLALDEKHAAGALKVAKGDALEKEALVAVAKAELSAARSALAQSERLERTRKAGTKEDVERAKTEVAVKQGKLAQAEAAVAKAGGGVEMAEVALEKARLARGLTRVVAPFDGVVTRRNFRNGSLVRPAEQGGPVPLLTIVRADRVRVVVNVPDREIPQTEAGAPVIVSVNALPDVQFSGNKVARLGFVVDPATAMMQVEVEVDNPRQALRPGMEGMAAVFLKASASAVRVPRSALIRDGGSTSLYLVRDGKARRIVVDLGTVTKKEAEIRSGLKPDDLVVTNPKKLKGEWDTVPVEVADRPAPK